MDVRDQAKRVFLAGVAAADPYLAVSAHLKDVVETPHLIIAVGKAAMRMAEAAMGAYPGVRTIVVTNPENARNLSGATVLPAAHPVPDERGAAAAEIVIAALGAATGPVLALISGGGSALLPAPAGAITLAEKARVNELLLGAGLDIRAMNLVRQQLSRIKGGGLLRAAAPNFVTALTLSDVVGDDLSTIASGPTVAPLGMASDAVKLLHDSGLWGDLPASVKAHLQADTAATTLPKARNVLVGSNALSLAAMAQAARGAKVIAEPVEGDVADAAQLICDACGTGMTIWGGETTVRLRGAGRGGRNQELALRIALEAEARGWREYTCLQGGSDGRDGPTDAAGGLVDQGTLARIAAGGGDVAAMLANNDSYEALWLAGDLLMTGATGTNIADLGVMIRV